MKVFILFITFSFVLCNYGIKVAETRLDYQSDDLGSLLDGQTSGLETFSTSHTDDPDKHRNVVRTTETILFNYTDDIN